MTYFGITLDLLWGYFELIFVAIMSYFRDTLLVTFGLLGVTLLVTSNLLLGYIELTFGIPRSYCGLSVVLLCDYFLLRGLKCKST